MIEPYFTARTSGPVIVAAVQPGLFVQMPELGGGGPTNAELVAGLHAAVGEGAARVVLDLRGAGEVNHRTVAAAVALARSLSGLGVPFALCGDAPFVQVWDLCRLHQLCPACTDLRAAVARVE